MILNELLGNNHLLRKITLCLMASWLFLLSIPILGFDIVLPYNNGQFIGFQNLLRQNWLAYTVILFGILSFLLEHSFVRKTEGSYNPSYEVMSVEEDDYSYLFVLMPCVVFITYLAFNSNHRYIGVTFFLLIIWFVYIQSKFYHDTIYKLYHAEVMIDSIRTNVVLISQDRIIDGQYVKWISIKENIWIVKGIKNDN